MMGQESSFQPKLFYHQINLDQRVPKSHILREHTEGSDREHTKGSGRNMRQSGKRQGGVGSVKATED